MAIIVKPDPPVLYCDASVTLAGRFTVVAGAIASVQTWKEFDGRWQQALKENGLRYFRMSEFAQSVGEFGKGWKKDEKRRQDFFLRMAGIVAEHVACWVGASVSQQEYEGADRIYHLHEYAQPFTVGGLTAIGLAHQWQRAQNLEYLPMEYVFEEGDEHSRQLWQRCQEWYGKYPVFRRKIEDESTSEEPRTPLQVADIAAYEIGKFYRTVDPEMVALFHHFRTSFALLGQIGHKWGSVGQTALRAEMNMRGVAKRSN